MGYIELLKSDSSIKNYKDRESNIEKSNMLHKQRPEHSGEKDYYRRCF